MINPHLNQEPLAIREAEAARLLGVSIGLIRKWRRIGGGPKFAKLGGASVAYRVADLTAFLESSIH